MADFFPTLRTRVQRYFKENSISKNGDWRLWSKTIALFLLYFGSFGLILSQVFGPVGQLLLCVTMGLGACGLGTSVMHDSLHGSYSPKKWVNSALGWTMELLGASSFCWKIQHNVLHHTFTNVYGHDEDIHDKPGLRLSPDGKKMWIHRFQHFYAIGLYGLSTLSWVVRKDFKSFFEYVRSGEVKKLGADPKKEFAKLVLSKIVYLAVFLGLPALVLPYSFGWILAGFVLMHFVTGLLLTLIFLTAHAVEGPEHPHPDPATGCLENNWAIHQVLTTANFRARTWALRWFVGGLDHQIEHHLFPQVSHVHYPEIAPIVRATALEFGLPYHEAPSFLSAVAEHFRYLKRLGQ